MLHEISSYKMSNNYMAVQRTIPKLVPIAPTTTEKYLTIDISESIIMKNNTFKNNPHSGAQAVSIARRNARERNRVKQVNDGFNALRKRLPATVIEALSGGSRRGSGKKLSKVDTLRMVVEYIKHMQTLIEESDAALGINTNIANSDKDPMSYEVDDGIYSGQNSPYSEAVPSPAGSEYSSGVSVNSCKNIYLQNCYRFSENQVNSLEDNELLDAISWWQSK